MFEVFQKALANVLASWYLRVIIFKALICRDLLDHRPGLELINLWKKHKAVAPGMVLQHPTISMLHYSTSTLHTLHLIFLKIIF